MSHDSVTRWDIMGVPSSYGPGPKKWTDPEGEWCRYSDVAPIVERCKKLEDAAQAFLYQTPFIGTDAYDEARTNLRAALKGETTDGE